MKEEKGLRSRSFRRYLRRVRCGKAKPNRVKIRNRNTKTGDNKVTDGAIAKKKALENLKSARFR